MEDLAHSVVLKNYMILSIFAYSNKKKKKKKNYKGVGYKKRVIMTSFFVFV